MFLSALPLTSSVESDEMSIDSTGSLWPYSDRKNLRLRVGDVLSVCVWVSGSVFVGGSCVECVWQWPCVATKLGVFQSTRRACSSG